MSIITVEIVLRLQAYKVMIHKPFCIYIHVCAHTLTEGMYRRHYSEAQDEESVPKIPVQPVSYGDAEHFLRCV